MRSPTRLLAPTACSRAFGGARRRVEPSEAPARCRAGEAAAAARGAGANLRLGRSPRGGEGKPKVPAASLWITCGGSGGAPAGTSGPRQERGALESAQNPDGQDRPARKSSLRRDLCPGVRNVHAARQRRRTGAGGPVGRLRRLRPARRAGLGSGAAAVDNVPPRWGAGAADQRPQGGPLSGSTSRGRPNTAAKAARKRPRPAR